MNILGVIISILISSIQYIGGMSVRSAATGKKNIYRRIGQITIVCFIKSEWNNYVYQQPYIGRIKGQQVKRIDVATTHAF